MTPLDEWELETGLINDVDGYIVNPRFGEKEEYAAKVKEALGAGAVKQAPPLMFLIDLENSEGEYLGSQGYSVGTGWIVSEDGLSISHPTRRNVVKSCIYGQLQHQVVKALGVDMSKYGKPTEAKSWDGLGFHWKQQEHATLTEGEAKSALMPTEFLGEKVMEKKPEVPAAASNLTKKLANMASVMDVRTFQRSALKLPEVAEDDALMAEILDDTDAGFWKKHQEGA